jgi:hypothetical protein
VKRRFCSINEVLPNAHAGPAVAQRAFTSPRMLRNRIARCFESGKCAISVLLGTANSFEHIRGWPTRQSTVFDAENASVIGHDDPATSEHIDAETDSGTVMHLGHDDA